MWQSTHVGGDRFAGNVVVFPQALYYGRVDPADTAGLVAAQASGSLDLDRYRGRAAYPFQVQAAEHAIRESEGLLGIDDLSLVGSEPHGEDAWRVRFRKPDADGAGGRRRRIARGRARVPHLRVGEAEPSPPLRGHGACDRQRLTRRKPSRTRRRARTILPFGSRSPGSSSSRNGASVSKHARTSAAA